MTVLDYPLVEIVVWVFLADVLKFVTDTNNVKEQIMTIKAFSFLASKTSNKGLIHKNVKIWKDLYAKLNKAVQCGKES